MEKSSKPALQIEENDSKNETKPLRKEWIQPEILPMRISSGTKAFQEFTTGKSS